jgi:hypothetical protein
VSAPLPGSDPPPLIVPDVERSAVCKVRVERTNPHLKAPAEFLEMLSRRWALCGLTGLADQKQGVLEIANNRWAILEPDASGALIRKEGPTFQGSVDCAWVADGQEQVVKCEFRSDLGQTVLLRPIIATPTPLLLLLGPHLYVAETPTI